MARSRLTRSPGARAPRLLRSRVSAMTSTAKPVASSSVTVRQTPLTQMEAPWVASLTTSGPSMRSTAESRPCSTEATVPSSSTIPVNMSVSSGFYVHPRAGAVRRIGGREVGDPDIGGPDIGGLDLGGPHDSGRDGVDAHVTPDDRGVDEVEPAHVVDGRDAEVGHRGLTCAQQ